MASGKDRFNTWISQSNPQRPLLLPLPGSLLARVQGMPYADIISNPGNWSAALQRTMELLGADGVIAGYEKSMLAAALGTDSGSLDPVSGIAGNPLAHAGINAAVETVRGLSLQAGGRFALVAGLAGPVSLCTELFPGQDPAAHLGAVKKPFTTLVEAFLRCKPDLVLFYENENATEVLATKAGLRLYATLGNLAAYYNVPLGLQVNGYKKEQLADIAALKVEALILGPDHQAGPADPGWFAQLPGKAPGLALPFHQPDLANLMAASAGGFTNGLLTSAAALEESVDLDSLLAACQASAA